jgi:DNA-binding beta-propeller fold protein YncE
LLFASAAIAAFTYATNPAAAVNLQFNQSFGTLGSGSGQFDSPIGVAVDSSGNVYVADYDNNRIDRFNFSNPTGTFTSFGNAGSGNGQFINPFGVAVDSSGNIYVADSGNNRIVQLSVAISTAVPEPSEVAGTLLAAGAAVALRRRLQRRRFVAQHELAGSTK